MNESPKHLILCVEDNADILLNIKLILEFNDYRVITATNGKEALDMLAVSKELPEVIVSDIMMPKMNGYDLFKAVSDHPHWASIPFIFLSAKSSPNDVRFGKMLGVDDYLTKPFESEDLLAILAGKIVRKDKIHNINQKLQELFESSSSSLRVGDTDEKEKNILLAEIHWDDIYGPKLESLYPKDINLDFSMNKVAIQLYQGAESIYGQENITKAEGILLNIENIKRAGYIYFDSKKDRSYRAGKKEFMLAVIAPSINYFQSLKIREILSEMAARIKKGEESDIDRFWHDVVAILAQLSTNG